jgi:hypothetical protein
VTVQGNSADGIQEPGTYHAAGIYLIQMSGATVANNTVTLASSGGTANVCAGVEVASGCSGLQISGNTINGNGNPYAYGVYAVGLSASSSMINNVCNHCQLVSGGATTSGNTISH